MFSEDRCHTPHDTKLTYLQALLYKQAPAKIMRGGVLEYPNNVFIP